MKTTGQLFIKDIASLPGSRGKKQLFETESVSVFSSRSHWRSFDDSFMQPCVYARLVHTELYPQFKGTDYQRRSCPFFNIHEFLLRPVFIPSGHKCWRESPSLSLLLAVWEFLFRTLKANSQVEIKLQFWKRCSSWPIITLKIVSLAFRLKLVSAVLSYRHNPESSS